MLTFTQVPSTAFAGQLDHVWELSTLLQKGSRPSLERFLDALAAMATMLVVFVPNRLWRDNGGLNMAKGLKCALGALWRLPAEFIGYPMCHTVEPDEEVVRARLFCEVVLGITEADSLKRLMSTELDELVLSVPTRDGVQLSLALSQSYPLIGRLEKPVRALATQWENDQPERRQRLMRELSLVYSGDALLQEVVDQEARDYQEQLLRVVHTTLGDADGRLVCDLLLSVGKVRDVMQRRGERLEAALAEYTKTLQAGHPILARSPEWMVRRIDYLSVLSKSQC